MEGVEGARALEVAGLLPFCAVHCISLAANSVVAFFDDGQRGALVGPALRPLVRQRLHVCSRVCYALSSAVNCILHVTKSLAALWQSSDEGHSVAHHRSQV